MYTQASILVMNYTPAQKLSSWFFTLKLSRTIASMSSVRDTLKRIEHMCIAHHERQNCFLDPKYMFFHVHGTEEHTQNALWPGLCSKYSAPNVEVWGRRGAGKEKSLWAKDQVLNLCGSLGFRGQATMRERARLGAKTHPPHDPILKKKKGKKEPF